MLQWLAGAGATVNSLEGEEETIKDLIRSAGPSVRQLQVRLSEGEYLSGSL